MSVHHLSSSSFSLLFLLSVRVDALRVSSSVLRKLSQFIGIIERQTTASVGNYIAGKFSGYRSMHNGDTQKLWPWTVEIRWNFFYLEPTSTSVRQAHSFAKFSNRFQPTLTFKFFRIFPSERVEFSNRAASTVVKSIWRRASTKYRL